MRTKLTLVLLLLGIPSAAFADIYVPSLVEMISSPLLWSIYIVTMVITVPVILIIGLIETLVVKRYIIGSFWRAFGWICLMNAITSLVRLPYSGSAVLWPGFPVSLILTIIAESALIAACLRKYLNVKSFRTAFNLSVKMNIASYAFLGIVLLGLFYIPVIGAEKKEVLRNLHGKLVIQSGCHLKVMDIATHMVIGTDCIKYASRCFSTDNDHSLTYVYNLNSDITQDTSKVSIINYTLCDHKWQEKFLGDIGPVKNAIAISGDGQSLLCDTENGLQVYDRKHNSIKKLRKKFSEITFAAFSPDNDCIVIQESIEQKISSNTYTSEARSSIIDLASGRVIKQIENAWRPVFSPSGSRLTWVDDNSIIIYDYRIGSRRRIIPRGNITGKPAWSPDGRFIAYYGVVNPFTSNGWIHDIRIIDTKTGVGATFLHDIRTFGRPCDMVWLK